MTVKETGKDLMSDIAFSLGAPPELLPFIPELLADLSPLGGSPERVVDLLRPLPLNPAATKVLDLGCGKGATAVHLAKELGFRVFGIDGFRPFIETAREMAEKHGVSNLCDFACGNLRRAIGDSSDYDVAVYAAGGVLKPEECVGKIRQTLRPGGYMVIHDVFLKPGAESPDHSGYENYAAYEETVRMYLSSGDALLDEIVFSNGEMREMNGKNTEYIRKRAAKLARRHPEKSGMFAAYVEDQERESEILENKAGVAIWLIQKTERRTK